MKCSICGATCRCKNAAGGICCSCHPHKARSVSALTQLRGGDRDPHQERWDELERERDEGELEL